MNDTISISAIVDNGNGGGGGGNNNTGGGGGGGGYFTSTASVFFSGQAYPLSHITILRDGQVVITTIAGPDANFSATVTNLNSGSYNFSLYAEDSSGRRSDSFSFPLIITNGASTTVSGIFITPTIDIDKTQVKQGDTLNIFGQSLPNSDVVISVHSDPETFHSIHTTISGAYFLNLDTSLLELGLHETKSKTTIGERISPYSKILAFTVGDKNIDKTTYCGSGVGDMNCDTRVDVIDFSILAYWYKRTTPPNLVDLNHDGKINIVDFSILASHWTG